MTKTAKQMLSLIILILAILIVGFVCWRAMFPQMDSLSEAQQILDKINKSQDNRGFYGIGQSCDKSGTLCQPYGVIKYPDGSSLSPYYTNLSIIWARYKIYEKTKDPLQLQKMQADIDNLLLILSSKSPADLPYVLQTSEFNCALMAEIATSPLIASDYQDKAKKICNQPNPLTNNTYFEFHPDSLVSRDGHQHPRYIFSETNPERSKNDAEYQQTSPGMSKKYVDLTDEAYSAAEIIISDAVAEKIAQLVDYHILGEGELLVYIEDEDEQFNFFTREAIAALDQLKASEMNANDPELAEANKVHSLLLLQEIYSWYLFREHNFFRSTDKCLLRANLTLFAKSYPQYLSQTQLLQIQAQLDDRDSFKESAYCAYGNYLADLPTHTLEQYQNTQRYYSSDAWQGPGILKLLGNDPNEFYYPHDINAIYAGLLANQVN